MIDESYLSDYEITDDEETWIMMDKYYAMRSHRDSYKLRTYDDAFPPDNQLQDLTDVALEILFPNIPKHGVTWKHGCVVGWPGCGKTELFKFLVDYAYKKYGAEKVNVCYCNDLAIAIDRLDARDVQLMIIDDAARQANSLNMLDKESLDSATIFQQLRHEYENISGKTEGIIICLFGWQRWTELRKTYRSGHVVIFKTTVSERSDMQWMLGNLGEDGYNILKNISAEILKENNLMKSLSVAYIPAYGQPEGVGVFKSKMVESEEDLVMLTRDNYEFVRRKDEEAEDDASWEFEVHRNVLQYAEGDVAQGAQIYQKCVVEKTPILVVAMELGLSLSKSEKLLERYRKVLIYERDEQKNSEKKSARRVKRVRARA